MTFRKYNRATEKGAFFIQIFVYYVAKFRASVDFLYQRKPLILRYFLELPSLSSFLNGNREGWISGVFRLVVRYGCAT